MKTFINSLSVMLAVMFACVSASAQSFSDAVPNTTSVSSAQQSTLATGTATNQGNAQSITFTAPADTKQAVEYSGTQTVKNVPSVSGPSLTSSNDTCMGSASGSANGAGFGFSLGKTYTDRNCVMLKNSRELWNMGMKAAALALMCTDAANKEALEQTGFECPQTTRNKQAAASNTTYTDPLVRARLGLPALEAAK